jgi:hypothetical protein
MSPAKTKGSQLDEPDPKRQRREPPDRNNGRAVQAPGASPTDPKTTGGNTSNDSSDASRLGLDRIPAELSTDECKNVRRWLLWCFDHEKPSTPHENSPELPTTVKVSAQPARKTQDKEDGTGESAALAQKLRTTKSSVDNTPEEVCNWEDTPVQDSRRYVVVNVQRVPSKRKPPGAAEKDVESVDVWQISVRDVTRDDAPTLEVYGAWPYPRRAGVPLCYPGGALDQSICSSDTEAHVLGRVVCNLMDRFPYSLQEEVWNAKNNRIGYTFERQLVEARSLDLWLPPFDRTRLFGSVYQNLGLGLQADPVNDTKANGQSFGRSIRCFPLHGFATWITRATSLAVRIRPDKVDAATISALPAGSPGFQYLLQQLPEDARLALEDAQKDPDLVLKAFQMVQQELMFKVGSVAQVKQFINTRLAKFGAELAQVLETNKLPRLHKLPKLPNGPKRPEQIWRIHDRQMGKLVLGSSARLHNTGFPNLIICTFKLSVAAYVPNKMLEAQKDDHSNPYKIWQMGVIAAEDVSLGRITEQEIKARYCSSENVDVKCSSLHVCMTCLKVSLCTSMIVTQDNRWICAECAKESSNMEDSAALFLPQTVTKAIERRLRNLKTSFPRTASKLGQSDGDRIDLDAVKIEIMKAIVDKDKGIWKDDYNGPRTMQSATYDVHTVLDSDGKVQSHPWQPSIDNRLPFTIWDGLPAKHAHDNVALIALCINYMKGTFMISILPALAAAAIQTERELKGAPRDQEFWTDFDNTMDRISKLQHLIPVRDKTRLERTSDQFDEELAKELLKSAKSSKWVPGQRAPFLGYHREDSTSADRMMPQEIEKGRPNPEGQWLIHRKRYQDIAASKTYVKWGLWTEAQKRLAGKLVDEMEKDERINPGGRLKIPRNDKRVPWPFRVDHMFEDEDLWEWWSYEALARYWTMFWECNFMFETYESPMTIFLEIIVQWFRSGGVYGFIHCMMTVFNGHAMRYSIARAGHVSPGSPMFTSFTTPNPTSIREHYNPTRSTVVIQPWCINMLWHKFPVELHGLIFQTVRDLAPQTWHYGPFLRNTDAVPFPKLSIIARRALRLPAPDPEVIVEEDAADEEFQQDPRDDEEDFDDDAVASNPENVSVLRDELINLRGILEDRYPNAELDELCVKDALKPWRLQCVRATSMSSGQRTRNCGRVSRTYRFCARCWTICVPILGSNIRMPNSKNCLEDVLKP